jgi:glycopeptide antibiotics resistance protein
MAWFFANLMLSIIFGFLLVYMGHRVNEWEWWAVLICFLLSRVFGFLEGAGK